MPLPQKKLIPGLLLALVIAALAAPPLWWSAGNPPVIDPAATENNHAPANIGQAKHMAKSALEALRPILPAVAYQIEADLVGPGKPIPSWAAPANQAEIDKNHAPLLIGQLKAIADPFYTRLHTAAPIWLEAERTANGTNHPGSIFPWTTATSDDNNKGMANIGQLKAAFSLRFTQDTDTDGMSDVWEIVHGFFPDDPADANADPDGDGIPNHMEHALGTDPNSFNQIGPVNLGFGDEITDSPDLSFRPENPSDLYHQNSVPHWNAAIGQHIEIWDEGDGKPYAELQSHWDAKGIEQEFDMLPGTRLIFILRYKGRYDGYNDSNAFTLKIGGAHEVLVNGQPVETQGSTKQSSFMTQEEWEEYAEWHYASIAITADPEATALIPITLTHIPEDTDEAITYGGFVDLLPVEVSWNAIAGFENVDGHIDPWRNTDIAGNRIFPDYKNPDDTEIRHKLELIVKTSPSLAGKAVFVKAFDVDDSTSEAFDADEVIDSHDNAGDDNLVDYLNTPKGGQFWTGSAWGGQTAQGTVDANGETKFSFRVGMQPGNNYRVVASVIDETMYAGVQTSDPAAPKYLGPETTYNGGTAASPLLTVWRRLWVENDSMEAIPTDEYGYVRNDLNRDLDPPVIRNVSYSATTDRTSLGIDLITDQSSFLNLDNGRITVQSVTHPVVDTHSYSVTISGNYGDIPDGSGYRLYDDDDHGLSASPLPRNDLVGEQMINYFRPSYVEVHDAGSFNESKLVQFRPNEDVSTNLAGMSSTVVANARELVDQNPLWVAPLTTAYQGPQDADKDPSGIDEGLRQGETATYDNRDHSTVFVEACREIFDQGLRSNNPQTVLNNLGYLEKYIIANAAHEIGHQPGVQTEEADHAEHGLMEEQLNGVSTVSPENAKFTPTSIHRFRKSVRWSQ